MGWEIFFRLLRRQYMQISNLSYVSAFEPDGDKITWIVQNGRNGLEYNYHWQKNKGKRPKPLPNHTDLSYCLIVQKKHKESV